MKTDAQKRASRKYYRKNKKMIVAKALAWRHAHPDIARKWSREKRWKKYGIQMTEAEYQSRLANQGGACAICGSMAVSRLHVDHDHQTSAVRDLLCYFCNRLAWDIEHIRAVLIYLEAHETNRLRFGERRTA